MEVGLLLERADLLVEQGRYKDAEVMIRKALEQEPENDYALALMGRCFINSGRYSDGANVVKQAISLDPNNSHYFYLLGFAQYRLDQNSEAEVSLRKAISLYPYSAEFYGLLSLVLLDERRFEEALDKANEGLAVEADNITCLNARASALNRLKRIDESYDTMQDALAADPDNAITHANIGWNHLRRGKNRDAEHHFMEALRIDPDMHAARVGLKESLKARLWLYKWLLQLQFWLQNQSGTFRRFFPFVLYVVVRILAGVLSSANSKDTALLVGALYLSFVVISWTIGSIADFVLLFHPVGKHSLEVKEKWGGITVVSSLVLAIAAFTISALDLMEEQKEVLFFAGMICVALAFPLGRLHYPIRLKDNSGKEWYALALVGLGLATLLSMIIAGSILWPLFALFAIGFIVYNWTGISRG